MTIDRGVVLVVDDSDAGRYVKCNILKRAGFEVEQARSGAEAFELLRTKRIQMILLDVQLPDMNGLEICESLRGSKEYGTLPILQTSATFTDAADAAAGLNRGADAYLTEPVREDVLIATVNALLRARKAEEELRQQRERFEVTLASIGDGVIATNMAGQIEFMNPVAETLSGWSRAEAVNRDIHEVFKLLDASTREQALPGIEECIERANRAPPEGGLTLLSRAGVEWPLEENCAPIRDTAGHATGLVITFREIGARQVAEARTRELLASEKTARQEAEKANRAKDEFLAIVSHELRTPLTSLMGWSRLLKGGTLSKEQTSHAIAVIERNIASQKQIIEDLLDVSRIVSGKLNLEKELIQLDAVISHSIESITVAAGNKGVEIIVDVPRVAIVADEHRMQQVLWNLLTNAIKFTPAGGRIEVAAERREREVVLTITDSGRGLDPAFLPYLFDRFTQIDASKSRETGGLGLGLAICRSLVEMHDGTIMAASAGVGLGSVFTITLPAAEIVKTEGGAESEPLAALEPTRLDGLHVLLVEDETDTREMVTLVLRSAGASVTGVGSAEEAMAAYLSMRPSILICDIGLPGEDGYQFMARLRKFEKTMGWSVPALALTAYAKADDRWQALKSGFQAHEGKPFEAATLVAVVASLTGHSRRV